MNGSIRFGWVIVALLAGLLAAPDHAVAQEYFAADVKDIKRSPQNYWARGIVFRDTLTSHPQRRTLKIDNRDVTRFDTKQLGELYVESEALSQIQALEIGEEYLFSGTVAQRGRRYYAIIRSVAPFKEEAESVPDLLKGIKKEGSTNQFNRVFEVLNTVMVDIHKDLFGYATSNNLTLEEMFSNPEYRDKVAASARTSLRRFEERSKTTSQEFFVSVIISMLALQYGYVEQAPTLALDGTPDVYVPNFMEAPDDLPWEGDVSPEAWDIDVPEEEAAAPVEPEVVMEPIDVAVEAVEEPVEETPEVVESITGPEVETPAVAEPVVEVTEEVVETVSELMETDEVLVVEEDVMIDWELPEAESEATPSDLDGWDEAEIESELVEEAAIEEVRDEAPADDPVIVEIEIISDEPEAETVEVIEVEVVPEPESPTIEIAPVEADPVPDVAVPEVVPVKEEIDYSRPMRLR